MNKYCLLDTNILSDTLKKNQSIHQKVLDKRKDGYDLCIHLLSLAELKRNEFLIDKFCNLTRSTSFHVIKPFNQLLTLEKTAFPSLINKSEIILISLNHEERKQLVNQHQYFKSDQFKSDAAYLLEGQQKAFQNLRDGIKGERDKNRRDYVDRYVWTQLSLSSPNFFKETINSNQIDSLKSLKSLFVQANFNYYKYIEKKQPIEMSDSYDTLIISCLPYVDLFLTERKNGGLLKELKTKLDIIYGLQVETMRDLRRN